jgi:hypothetical protein
MIKSLIRSQSVLMGKLASLTRWTRETVNVAVVVVVEAAPGEAQRTDGPKRTSSRGSANA